MTSAKLAAARRDRLVAVRHAARPADRPSRSSASARRCARSYGRDVHLNLDVDPEVLGGLRVQVGDEVIDGTIADRLDDAARRRLAELTTRDKT